MGWGAASPKGLCLHLAAKAKGRRVGEFVEELHSQGDCKGVFSWAWATGGEGQEQMTGRYDLLPLLVSLSGS